ncbi:hypothetical protein [Paenibacillus faecalis]|uniref:hypothetical protein n=1 Tax=Paenibacillus faecalis TaxID=2079532 RepID=UPI000D1129EC|nr:hypothetical protein [Paenibacillus faecalis]
MRRACNQIFWGFLLILIDIRIDLLDIFPDLLGYLLLLTGLYQLKRLNVYFSIGYGSAWALMIISFIQFFAGFDQQPVSSDPLYFSSPVNYGLSIVPLIVQLVFGYGLCKGIEVHADTLKQTELKRAARTRLRFYAAVYLMWMFILPFHLNVKGEIMQMLFFMFGIGILICTLSVILLVRAAARLWDDKRGVF